jgi:polar amino acid transport system substrate-binding protein
MKKFKVLVALALMFAMFAAMSGCGGKTPQSSPESSAPVETTAAATNGQLVLATSADYPPYEFHKLIDGKDQIVGFDISLAQLIADKMGKELVIRDVSFDSCLVELNMDKADMVIAGMSPDPDRDAAFSDIYYDTTQCVLVRKGEAANFKDVASLAGSTIGAQASSAQEKAAKAELPDSKLVSLQKIPDLLLNLTTGKCDAVVMEKFVAMTYLQTNSDIEIAFDLNYDTAGCAVAIKKGNDDLLEQINQILNEAISDGTLDKYVDDASKLAAGQLD